MRLRTSAVCGGFGSAIGAGFISAAAACLGAPFAEQILPSADAENQRRIDTE